MGSSICVRLWDRVSDLIFIFITHMKKVTVETCVSTLLLGVLRHKGRSEEKSLVRALRASC